MIEDFSLTSPIVEKPKRQKPVLTKLGERIVTSDGRWHPDLVAEYIRDQGGRKRWIKVGELARVFFDGNTQSNRHRVRRRLHKVWQVLLDRDELLVVEIHQREGAQACKLYDPRSVEERQVIDARIARMNKHRFLKAEQLEKALRTRECLETAFAEA
jgi:hypothetical protein